MDIPTRSEICPGDTWDLRAIFPSGADWENAFEELRVCYTEILKFRGHLLDSPKTLKSCLEFKRKIDMLGEKIREYAALRLSEDSSNNQALDREARLASFTPHLQQSSSFIAPELQRIPDDVFVSWLQDPSLEEWTFFLQKILRTKPHTLSEPEERLLALVEEALGGASTVFRQLTNVDMNFGHIHDRGGVYRKIQLTQNTLASFLTRRDRTIRRRAFRKFYQEFSDHRYTLSAALVSSVRRDVFHARVRNFSSSQEAALFYDDVPLSIYDNLIFTIRTHLPLLHRYYSLRRRVLKLPAIHIYDTLVPLVDSIQMSIPFEEAVEKVLSSVAPLGEEYVSVLRRGLMVERWCDRYENKGKHSGAFSAGSYSSPPYLLMNYKQDVFSDLYTLAHEVGHSMHTWYSSRAQSFQNYRYPIFLAEVASTFNEALLTEHLLAKASASSVYAYLLNRQIDDLQGSLFRQTMFAEFEKIIHTAEEEGRALTLEFLRSSYRSLLDAFFGHEVVVDDVAELECLRIPHFYDAFYVYKYATGVSAAVTLCNKVLASGDASAYLGLLRSGGSRFPIETLQAAGVDMNSPEPIQVALHLFARRLEELEALLE
ncbi:Oligoendopeptidase F, plasmid [Candidatus Xiphinematobacter sp. Idaho Grape]|uniref:oligoendopeptidase F n=1 Tax=Candidatus Xiphinematobacter sp. Idaho Grape TaxID=1704307 RepID=UPI000706E096|nr:oligoendopeptidase F [Candidatus Xiphinematobacter sp. Idaho Grape]ALJ56687.1 Oligoendopeptidase F, plasmid [Candidatus Xiphinematobacter sp. Idaho Grape]